MHKIVYILDNMNKNACRYKDEGKKEDLRSPVYQRCSSFGGFRQKITKVYSNYGCIKIHSGV